MDREPDLRLAGLSIWVLGRQYPDRDDFWDGNWLNVRARVEAIHAVVEAYGPIVRTTELASFVDGLEALDSTLAGCAFLKCMEPNLDVAVRGESLGHVTVTVTITPDPLSQAHELIFSIDQSFLRPTIAQCRRILSSYPIRDGA